MQELIDKVTLWAHDRNLVLGSNTKAQCLKLMSEVGELADNINKNNECIDDIGDCFVVLIILSNQLGVSLEACLQHAYDEIKDRKGVMYNGCFIKSTDERYEQIIKELSK